MVNETNAAIDTQRKRLFSALALPEIAQACSVNNGICSLTDQDVSFFRSVFEHNAAHSAFFIPASGVGSRMFDFLQQYIGSRGTAQGEELAHFMKYIKRFAFYQLISAEWKEKLEKSPVDFLQFCDYLLNDQGLNFSGTPKALFPFHWFENKTQSPIDGHLRIGASMSKPIAAFHFTVQQEHLNQLEIVKRESASKYPFEIEFSTQLKETDSFVFDELQQPIKNHFGEYIKRPAGHGALLSNLNRIKSPLIFIKNIDNISCPKWDQAVNGVWEMLGGILHYVRNSLIELRKEFNVDAFKRLNEQFDLFDLDTDATQWDDIAKLANRPLRICGMVKNEGMPGGGPFWILYQGKKSKQIIEKSQVDLSQLSKLSESTHFNPVIMALSTLDLDGNPFNLNDFVREDLSMAVKKNHMGKTVYYMEKPGLWNGSMYHWNSVFVEIPSSVFSPVKSVMDLLHENHSC